MQRTLSIFCLAALLAGGPSAPAAAQALRGSPVSVERIHQQALRHDLHFYETGAGVEKAAANGRFVRLSGNSDYRVHDVSYPYVLPATLTLVQRLASQYRSACGEPLVITSAVRPRALRLVNSHPKSVHPTGMAVDIRRPRNGRCLAWLRKTLVTLNRTGVVEAVEERRPPHFHVAVFPTPYQSYVQRRGGKVVSAPVARAEPGTASTRTYRVRRGDSLWSIARRHAVTVPSLKNANGLQSAKILAGQELVIPEAR